jgi:DNA modification methylase
MMRIITIAALNLKRKFIGIEKDNRAFEMAKYGFIT